MFIFKAGPRKVFRLKLVHSAKKVADPCIRWLEKKHILERVVELSSVYNKFSSRDLLSI